MSIRLMSVVWEIDFPTQSQKLIALKLADYAADSGASIFPTVNTLAKHTGCDERTVQRVMKAFRSCGLLHLVKEGGTGPKATNQWQMNVTALVALAYQGWTLSGGAADLEINGEGMGDILSDKGDILSADDALRVTNPALRVTPVSPKGGSGVTQSINIHHKELPSRTSAHATQGAARSARSEVARLILASDKEWRSWRLWLADKGQHRALDQFEAEGAMVVYDPYPSDEATLPRLAPPPDSEKRLAMEASRKRVVRDPTGEAA